VLSSVKGVEKGGDAELFRVTGMIVVIAAHSGND
jgi:hypothetical protein